MEQQQRSLIFTAAVGLIILAIIVGSIYYLVKFIQTRIASSKLTPQASVEMMAEASQSGIIAGESVGEVPQGNAPQTTLPATGISSADRSASLDNKLYNQGGFQLSYPKNWGMWTCVNSENFEFDPVNSEDKKVQCGTALKPITVLVDDISGCDGANTMIGNIEVVKSVQTVDGYISYQWCTKTNPVLNITHRVSKNGERAVSKDDYSAQIEDMISKLSFTAGGGS